MKTIDERIKDSALAWRRDFFAGRALTGLLAHPDAPDVWTEHVPPNAKTQHSLARMAYRLADAMIAESAK
jgi:hypothetical protein